MTTASWSVNEGSVSWLDLTFQNAPASVRYRIDCLSNSQEIVDWTALVPGTTVSIKITSDKNVILNDYHPTESRRITVEATYANVTDLQTEQYDFSVVNLSHYPSI